MKNIFIFLFAIFSLSTVAQINVSVENPANPKPSGTPFIININYINPTITSCRDQKIELNLGSLEYLPANSIIGSAVANVSTSGGNNILTITNIPYQIGVSITLLVGVKFKEGTTCNGAQTSIFAKYFECGNLIKTTEALTISASASNKAKIYLRQITAYDKKTNVNSSQIDAFCLGKKVRYSVEISNYDAINSNSNGVNFNSPIIYVELPNCAIIKGVYKNNTFETVNGNFNETTSGSTKIVSWIGENVPFSSTSYFQKVYDIEVEYPCTNTTCIGDLQLKAYAISKDCNNQDIETQSPRPIIVTKMLPNCDDSCTTGNGGYQIDFSYALYCPSSCNTKSNTVIIDFYAPGPISGTSSSKNVAPTGDSLRVYKVTLPDNINLLSERLTGANTICNNLVQVSYLDQANNPTNQANAKHILFKIACFDFSYRLLANIRFNYKNPSLVTSGSSFIFGTTATINDQVFIPYREFTATVNNCNPIIRIRKELKKVTTDNSSNFTTSALGISNDVFIYRIKITNVGDKEQLNSIFTDPLDSNQIFLGGLKIAYTNDPNLTNIPLVYGNSYTLPGTNNRITITKPIVNNSSGGGTLSFSNFTLPCDDTKYLIIEFKVKIKQGVYTGTQIKNRITSNSGFFSNETLITVPDIGKYETKFLVWCEDNQEWYDDYVMIRRNENTKLKLRVINTGTKDIILHNILNLRPLTNDNYESNTDPRNTNVPFELKYDCSKTPSVYLDGNQLNNTQVQVDFASNGVDMNRQSLVCDYTQNGSVPNFSNSCNTDTSNWMKVDFKQGLILKPSQTIEVIYNAKATGNELGTIRNSFATLASDTNGRCLLSPIQRMGIEKTEEGCKMTPPKPCNECSSFELIKNKKYLVSGWVREESENEPTKQYLNFEKSYISVAFTDKYEESFQDPIKFAPSGEIIDGWQRIIGEFTVPQESAEFYLELVNDSNISSSQVGTVSYFDDIRIIPSEGNMKSYVYDQKTQRLMAELDENNFSTFYEYDLEGGLIRIKKETEKGVFTIQETRKSSVINKQ
ncbi:hypothetical protein [Flavobacterium columnare]|uniref:hypothetical protein n=1 Tax=Flavobacterium columnare TaxID=996 RepID=UPI004034C6A1